MFKPVDKTQINQVSLTGVRAIVVAGLLIEAPRSLAEIQEEFIRLNLMEKGQTTDIIRIDMNTLKSMNCIITRADCKTGYKYHLLRHPFSLNIKKEEMDVIKRAFKKIKNNAGIDLLLKYDELFKKISTYADPETKEAFYGLSILKEFNADRIRELNEDCKNKRTLKLEYHTPSAKKSSEKNIVAQKLVFQNDSIYLYGFDLDKKKSVVLNVKRILSIISRLSDGNGIELEMIKVKFFLKKCDTIEVEENEQIIETLEDGCIIEGKYYNDFLAIQRILSFGANCTVLEPQEFKETIIEKLKNMRDVYNV